MMIKYEYNSDWYFLLLFIILHLLFRVNFTEPPNKTWNLNLELFLF